MRTHICYIHVLAPWVRACVSRVLRFFFCEVYNACVGTNRDRQHFLFWRFFYEVHSACIGTNRDRQQQAGIQQCLLVYSRAGRRRQIFFFCVFFTRYTALAQVQTETGSRKLGYSSACQYTVEQVGVAKVYIGRRCSGGGYCLVQAQVLYIYIHT